MPVQEPHDVRTWRVGGDAGCVRLTGASTMLTLTCGMLPGARARDYDAVIEVLDDAVNSRRGVASSFSHPRSSAGSCEVRVQTGVRRRA